MQPVASVIATLSAIADRQRGEGNGWHSSGAGVLLRRGIGWIDSPADKTTPGCGPRPYVQLQALQNSGLLGDEADEDVAQVRMLDARADSGRVLSGDVAEVSRPATNCRMSGRTADARPGS